MSLLHNKNHKNNTKNIDAISQYVMLKLSSSETVLSMKKSYIYYKFSYLIRNMNQERKKIILCKFYKIIVLTQEICNGQAEFFPTKQKGYTHSHRLDT